MNVAKDAAADASDKTKHTRERRTPSAVLAFRANENPAPGGATRGWEARQGLGVTVPGLIIEYSVRAKEPWPILVRFNSMPPTNIDALTLKCSADRQRASVCCVSCAIGAAG